MLSAQYVQKKQNAPGLVVPPNVAHTSSACNLDSRYHDLKCGHRVRTTYPDNCGDNCKSPQGEGNTKFICQVCVTSEVRTLIQLEDLGLSSSNGTTTDEAEEVSREEKILQIAKKEIDKLIRENCRVCQNVEKLHPLLQFYSEIAGAEDEGGFMSPPPPTPGRMRPHSRRNTINARPRLRSRSPMPEEGSSRSRRDDPREDRFRRQPRHEISVEAPTGRRGDTDVGPLAEDEVEKAVRETLEGLTLVAREPESEA
ncbi:hypothetical protein K505DRAFT_330644 [Melanomma pulvis-pyrius CBS 109.77]|uniref:Uncharacterized protein n=1 Tax=Melanomma pulvis-pyrius CBS 109.77 TaxID=1314802 RepID=A0A6A6WPI5_9PLEO|nr:hypothetical protein K505DRAFT_330644 [Melanomma pulvis-pyrius CBS 109.77]